MLWEARAVFEPVTKKSINVRIGIHSGPLVAGVVALCMPRYCLFGETISIASSIEMHGLPGKIHCSEKAYKFAMKTGRFDFTSRGRVFIKGKGEMATYLLVRSTKKSVWEIVVENEDSFRSFMTHCSKWDDDDDDGSKCSIRNIDDTEAYVHKNSIDGYEELETGMNFATQQHTIVRPLTTQASKTCSIS
ncbi:adenylate/guanylate cyclase catalytic domain protein [Ancylostoma duodenale]|uniref:Adenylate/guanylate cyclase catalytic domain protein n=1 Tax=Ancylostoma duodenale TaxID=51022 RepID=A0A0C2CCP1_9BILA|nr:adenylate/guanylate cyclase catalytic domain protein [Ancylostoma duodenale]